MSEPCKQCGVHHFGRCEQDAEIAQAEIDQTREKLRDQAFYLLGQCCDHTCPCWNGVEHNQRDCPHAIAAIDALVEFERAEAVWRHPEVRSWPAQREQAEATLEAIVRETEVTT